jgi:hypothetical protein
MLEGRDRPEAHRTIQNRKNLRLLIFKAFL